MIERKDIRVLVACEESQAVCTAFRGLGFTAFSCDLLECSGGHPEWHIQGDAIDILNIQKWHLVIAHPPCTRMANSGVMWLEKRNLWKDLDEATTFFNEFVKYGRDGNAIAIENPIPHNYAVEKIGKYSQVIQPYMFGHAERKATCLWLFGLPELKETNNVMEEMKKLPKKEQQRIHYLSPGKERAKLRSKTFPGIAKSMAEQWGDYIYEQLNKKQHEANI
ncbi:MAG: hypothetical protein EOM44_12975 [Bacteroidia bacterium]|nr:hypothetical protein [Bacteroidia bacterium]